MPHWSVGQLKYQGWLSIPVRLRPKDLRTRKQVALKLGFEVDDLCQWEAEPGWWDAVFALSRSIIGHKVASILDSMANEAIGGSVMAAKLCLEVLGVHADRLEHKIALENDQLVVTIRTTPDTPKLPEGTSEAIQQHVRTVAAAELAAATSHKLRPPEKDSAR